MRHTPAHLFVIVTACHASYDSSSSDAGTRVSDGELVGDAEHNADGIGLCTNVTDITGIECGVDRDGTFATVHAVTR
ncbi:MAG: hypothetical protein RMK74_16570, partial [Myxococcales bacterium]|nr:hypothetical protein [Myxococcales bacterium]